MAETNEKMRVLGPVGVVRLFKLICNRFDKKLDSIESADDSTEVISGRKVAVQISAAEDNNLQVRHEAGYEGLYVPPIPPVTTQKKLIFGNSGQYVYDGSSEVIVPVYQGEILY